MKTYIIERELPGVGDLEAGERRAAAGRSNQALARLAPRVQWVLSFVAADKTFCLYRAENEDVIRQHAKLSGFPAQRITEIRGTLDPTSAATG